MRLTELKPRFLKRTDDHRFNKVEVIGEADGIMFLCPVCFVSNKGAVGTHAIICWGPHVPQTTSPTPGRWEMQGTGFEDLTLVAGSSSVFLQGPGCGAHFHIRNGDIV